MRGGGAGGEDLDFGDEGEDEDTDEAGAEGGAPAGDDAAGGEASPEGEPAEAAPAETSESVKRVTKLLKEQKVKLGEKLDARTKKYKGRFVDMLLESIKKEPKQKIEKTKIYDKNVKINKDIDDMINGIDKMLE